MATTRTPVRQDDRLRTLQTLATFNATPQAATSSAKEDKIGESASEWIFAGGPIWDGDAVSFFLNKDKGRLLDHGPTEGGMKVTKCEGGKANKVLASGKVEMGNRFTWIIRKVFYNKETQTWWLNSADLSDRTIVMTGDPFILYEPGPKGEFCLGTAIPAKHGSANNGDYKVQRVPYDLSTVNSPCGLTFTAGKLFGRQFSSPNCKDWIDASTRVWYFQRWDTKSSNGVTYGAGYNLRNMYTLAKFMGVTNWERAWSGQISSGHFGFIIGLAMKFNGGRNLTTKGTDHGFPKLALSNNDKQDIAQWYVHAWLGDEYPVRRSATAKALSQCRPGQYRNAANGACYDGPPCKEGFYFNQEGVCVEGSCPTGAVRTEQGYCNDPTAGPSTPNGQRNVFYDETSHNNWLAQQEVETQERLAKERQQQSCPPGQVNRGGSCVQVDESRSGLSLETDITKYAPCADGLTRSPASLQCVPVGGGPDPRSWWEKLVYQLFGKNWNELDLPTRLAIMGVVFGGGGLVAVTTVQATTAAVIKKVI